jgi:hypothetical protein
MGGRRRTPFGSRRRTLFIGSRRRRSRVSDRAAIVIAILALVLSATGLAGAAGTAVTHQVKALLVDGHVLSAKPTRSGLLLLGRNRKFPAAAIPANLTVDRAKLATSATTAKTATTAITAITATTAKTATNATMLGGKTAAQMTGGCPSQTADIGTWCLMINPYPLTQAQSQEGVNNYPWAAQACVAIGGFLPSASDLIGAADLVKLESTVDDNNLTATIEGVNGPPAFDQREMSSTLVTTTAGSDAAGSEGVSADDQVAPGTGQPQPTPEPAVPYPQSLQYVTVYSNGTKGGFAGSEPENFRCGFYLKPGQANQTVAIPSASSGATVTTQDAAPSTGS